MKPSRVYVDTSVFGGCFDAEFSSESKRFFELINQGRILVLVSQVVIAELSAAPPAVQELFDSLPSDIVVRIDLSPDMIELREAYISAGIVPRRFVDDATHVAAATVARADAIVSWNFMHIVRFDKVRAYNRANLEAGFGLLSIVTPQEVRFDEDE